LLSLVVIALDEADRIADCLGSVPFAAERLVLDCGSTDGTQEVARACGATVLHTDWPGHVAQKNRALAAASQPWVLSLDADERLTAAAQQALREALAAPGDATGFAFARCSTWLGTPLRHGRWYPDRKVRVVRRGHGRWVGDDPHDHLQVDGPVRRLRGDIAHRPYRDLSEHLATIDRYTRVHAGSLHARGVRARWWDVAVRPPLHFVDAFLLRRGFLDGTAGFAVAGLGATHVLLKWTRLWMLQEG
jgi:glycosyltransferase involved in cell wall biosynthesis